MIASAICLVYPSKKDAFPLTLLECLSLGTPSIAYPVGGIPTIVKSGFTGYLVNEGDIDAIETHFNIIRGNREKFSENSRLWFEKMFSMSAYEQKWDLLLKSVQSIKK